MNAAELRLKKQGLGLTLQDLANIFDVAYRTPSRWLDGDSPVPDYVEEKINELWDERIQFIHQQAVPNSEGALVLYTYSNNKQAKADSGYTLQEHTTLVAQAALLLDIQGKSYTVEHYPTNEA